MSGRLPAEKVSYLVGDPRLRNGTTLRSRFRLATISFATATSPGTLSLGEEGLDGGEEVIGAILLPTGQSFNFVLVAGMKI